MSWTCPCTAIHPDGARFCDRCGRPFEPARAPATAGAPEPAAAPVQTSVVPRASASSSNLWKLGVVVGVLVFGGVFGTGLAVSVFGLGSTSETAQTTPKPDTKSASQQAFDAGFKRSCRQSAMGFRGASQSAADRYCDCALTVFNESHSMAKAVSSCQQYAVR